MKNNIYYFCLIILIGLFASCERDGSRLDDFNTITEEEAVELVQETLTSESYGAAIQVIDATDINDEDSNKQFFECNVLNERSFIRSSSIGAAIVYNHAINYNFTKNCDETEGVSFTIDFEGVGTYSSIRMDSDDTITYQATLSNIGDDADAFVYEGSLLRLGTQVTRIAGRTKNFDSRLSTESSAITIDKKTRLITGGSTSFLLTGNLDSGESFSYEGSITYLGNGQATVQINGNTYNTSI